MQRLDGEKFGIVFLVRERIYASMIVLGLHGGVTLNQHEASATLLIDGSVVALCEEERYTRQKSAYGAMPHLSILDALNIGGVCFEDVDLVVVAGLTYPDHELRWSLYLRSIFGVCPEIAVVHHQEAHLAAAFFSSGLEKALCISIDASGDSDSSWVAKCSQETGIQVVEKTPNTNSLGIFYTLMTHYLGFSDGDEYKVMGLAPYGTNRVDLSSIISITESGWTFNNDLVRTLPPLKSPFEPIYDHSALEKILGPVRSRTAPLQSFHQDLALSAQLTFEDCLAQKIRYLSESYPGYEALCMAGGAALNCSANKKLLESDSFNDIYVPPVPSDRGLSLGCAYLGAVGRGFRVKPIDTAYLGSSYSNDSIERELIDNGIDYSEPVDLLSDAARLLSEQKILGWFDGRSEAGARALGNRSILASCSSEDMRSKVNEKIKYREKFRPFAPLSSNSSAREHFKLLKDEYPFMSFTVDVQEKSRELIPAVTHVDGTARLQTVSPQSNAKICNLLHQYEKDSSISIIMNTSFNLKDEPIVNSPRDAIRTFFGCGLDALVLGPFLIRKKGIK